ncbi:hypothetical protein OPKNFCMD_1988 [Methylobacterium crusticola]|uniref:Uncharacterized protein n=1 Tax=Methylobacterium crusticola TaxID=1697972 RepID=A0ABQ4QV69_9HYPH|nr:hypothetical protein OPKNFCMD_1988 [Methylobacterium crusticola]
MPASLKSMFECVNNSNPEQNDKIRGHVASIIRKLIQSQSSKKAG